MSQHMQALSRALARAQDCLARRDISGAEQALAPLGPLGLSTHPSAMGATGIIRMHQNRLPEAVALLTQSRMGAPGDPALALNLGRALAGSGRRAEAEAAMREALRLQPGWPEGHFELGQLLHRSGKLEDAETEFRNVLRLLPDLMHAVLALGAVLTDRGLAAEAETILKAVTGKAAPADLQGQVQLQLATALLRQRKDAQALAAANAACAAMPQSSRAALCRAQALENLERPEEALAILRELLARQPDDPALHHDYNALLYRIGREQEFLRSYSHATAGRPLMLGKAHMLDHAGRHAEAYEAYAALLARDGQDALAAIGAARMLVRLKRPAEASTAFDAVLQRPDIPVSVFAQAGEAALLANEPQKAAHLCERGLVRAPGNGDCLATLSTAWRMLGDERDEELNGYDRLVQIFDLEPPQGFDRMEDFNAELDAALNRLHPQSREFLGQSLRGGTQTPDDLFGMALPLVQKLKTRIDEAVLRYIRALPENPAHPFLSRRTAHFRYAGAWSSRLRDRGYHVNHIHPMGWISSCYYVAAPPAASDTTARQGWIKFGEPQLELPLKNPIRRAIQPRPGRLVLFPSYLWHGTIPFRDAAARTTIAFDIVPTT